MKFGTLILSLGVALLVLSTTSINAHVSYTLVLTRNPVTFYVPSTVMGHVSLIENATNTSAYVIVYHEGEKIVKLPYSFTLSPGNYTIRGYEEVSKVIVNKVVKLNESLSCGNVSTEKVIPEEIENVSSQLVYPVYVHLSIQRMNLVRSPEEVGIVGFAMILFGIALIALRFKRE
ncbi:MAG: hypothetical protein QXR86_03610 [Metallosphaera sp.]